MKVAFLRRRREPLSVVVYRNALLPGLSEHGVDTVPFSSSDGVPAEVDVIWHPGSGMGRVPAFLTRADLPVVCTVHGLDSFSLSLGELSAGPYDVLNHFLSRWLRKSEWRRLAPRVARVVAVSRYGREEIERHILVDPQRISVIHHGVDTEVFRPAPSGSGPGRPFLLHVSSFHPKKNYRRLLEAYSTLKSANRPILRMVVPGFPARRRTPEGVEIVRQSLDGRQLAQLYGAATAFVFPSLHETFGLPILEAMACGCPVITSTETACPEIAGDAALLVDPRSVEAIATAMSRVADDSELGETLRQRGLDRASEFTWDRSAQLHVEAFRKALARGSRS